MGNLKNLREIKSFLKEIKKDMSTYSDNMPDVMFNLYTQTPISFKQIELPYITIKDTDYINHFSKILKHIANHELTKTYMQSVKDRKLNIQFSYKGTAHDFVEYSSQVGQFITRETFEESEFIKTYLPRLCKYLYELLSIKTCSTWQSNNINQELFRRRFYNISRYIWDLHVLDELSKPRLFLDIDKTNSTLEEEGYKYKVTDVKDAKSRYKERYLRDINSYIVANILLSELSKDEYTFYKKLVELNTTDNMNYEEVLEHLRMNYIQHDDIIKSLTMNNGDKNGRTIN